MTSDHSTVTVRHEQRAGDLGRVISFHGERYASEFGFGLGFETYVAETIVEFGQQEHPERDRLWVAEIDGRLVGCIAILGREDGAAQLRWFLIDPATRGQGLGRRLVTEALDFCRGRPATARCTCGRSTAWTLRRSCTARPAS